MKLVDFDKIINIIVMPIKFVLSDVIIKALAVALPYDCCPLNLQCIMYS